MLETYRIYGPAKIIKEMTDEDKQMLTKAFAAKDMTDVQFFDEMGVLNGGPVRVTSLSVILANLTMAQIAQKIENIQTIMADADMPVSITPPSILGTSNVHAKVQLNQFTNAIK